MAMVTAAVDQDGGTGRCACPCLCIPYACSCRNPEAEERGCYRPPCHALQVFGWTLNIFENRNLAELCSFDPFQKYIAGDMRKGGGRYKPTRAL